MPLPILLAAAPVASSTVYTGVRWAISGAFYLYQSYEINRHQQSSSFAKEAEEIARSVRVEVDELASRTDESLRKDEEKSKEELKRMNEALGRFDSGLTSMEGSARHFDDVVADAVASGETRSETIHGLAEAQAEVQSGLDLQQADVRSIAESLKNLPELFQANREKQALRLENERLRLQNSGYVERLEKVLDFSKEQKLENEQLKIQVQGLETKVSGYSSRIRNVIALAKEKQDENDALKNQMSANGTSHSNKENTFGVRLFK